MYLRRNLIFCLFIAPWREFKFRFLWLQVTKILLPLENFIFKGEKKVFPNLCFFSLISSITFSSPNSSPFLFLTLSHFTLSQDSLTWYSWCPSVFFHSLVSCLHDLHLFKISLFFKPFIKFYSFPLPFSVTPKINLFCLLPVNLLYEKESDPCPHMPQILSICLNEWTKFS